MSGIHYDLVTAEGITSPAFVAACTDKAANLLNERFIEIARLNVAEEHKEEYHRHASRGLVGRIAALGAGCRMGGQSI